MMAELAKFEIFPKKIKMNPKKQLQTGDALASILAKYLYYEISLDPPSVIFAGNLFRNLFLNIIDIQI